jgi:hypothetical protein
MYAIDFQLLFMDEPVMQRKLQLSSTEFRRLSSSIQAVVRIDDTFVLKRCPHVVAQLCVECVLREYMSLAPVAKATIVQTGALGESERGKRRMQ